MNKASKTIYYEIEEHSVGEVAEAINFALTSEGFVSGVRPEVRVEASAATEDGTQQAVEREASELSGAMIYDVDSVNASRVQEGVDHMKAIVEGGISRIRVEPHKPWWTDESPYLKVWITAPSAEIVLSLAEAFATRLGLEVADPESDREAILSQREAAPSHPVHQIASTQPARRKGGVSQAVAVILALAAAFALGAFLF